MGHRTSIKNPRLTKRLPLEEAETVFLNHCRIKNLSPRTILSLSYAHINTINNRSFGIIPDFLSHKSL